MNEGTVKERVLNCSSPSFPNQKFPRGYRLPGRLWNLIFRMASVPVTSVSRHPVISRVSHTTPQLSPSRQSIPIGVNKRGARRTPVASRHEAKHSPGSKASSAKAANIGAIAARRGHTTPAHAALARRRAHAAWRYVRPARAAPGAGLLGAPAP